MVLRSFAFALALVAPLKAVAQDIPELLKHGDEYFSRAETSEALPYYVKAYEEAPGEEATIIRLIRTYADLGWLHLHTDTTSEGYYCQAARYADTLVALYPSLPAAHFWEAMTRGSLIPFGSVHEKLRLGKTVRAEAEKAVSLDSTFALPYIVLAIFERESAQLSWFERTIANVIFGGDLHGSFEASEAYLAKAVKYDSANSYAYYEMYWTYLAEGRRSEAAEALRRVLAIPARSQREARQHQLAQNYLEKLEQSAE
ncbi:MAG TPA: hypothetical protein VMG34_13850 [Bacteroidota bacterium]|nr:hypothetical protein [Bacteroidota bacterium]